MNKEILFEAAFGDEVGHVRLLGMNGHNGWYHVYMDNYFMGQMFYRDETWVFFGNSQNEFTFEDVYELGERIENWKQQDFKI